MGCVGGLFCSRAFFRFWGWFGFGLVYHFHSFDEQISFLFFFLLQHDFFFTHYLDPPRPFTALISLNPCWPYQRHAISSSTQISYNTQTPTPLTQSSLALQAKRSKRLTDHLIGNYTLRHFGFDPQKLLIRLFMFLQELLRDLQS